MQKPTILKREIVADGNVFSIERLYLRFSNGNERIFERLVSLTRGAVLIVPLVDNDNILLVREYAAGVDRYELGFPKGLIDSNEDPLQAANRELMEEVGYGAKELLALKSMTAAPGYWGSSVTIVLAKDLYPAKLPGDEPEELEVVPWRLSNYHELIAREDFTESRSIAALLLVKDMCMREKDV